MASFVQSPQRVCAHLTLALACCVSAVQSQTAPASLEPPVVLPPVNVKASRPPTLSRVYQKLDHLFEGAFPTLRNGEMIEAILWRHRYLRDHPGQPAVIVTDQDQDRLIWAATVYADKGRVYASNIAFGEHQLLEDARPSDIISPYGIRKLRRAIGAIPVHGVGAQLAEAEATGDYQVGLAPNAGRAPILDGMIASGDGPPQLVGGAAFASTPPGSPPATPDALLGEFRSQAHGDAKQALETAGMQAFGEPADEIMNWSYQALRDPNRAGLVPVALSEVDLGPLPLPPAVIGMGQFPYRRRLPQKNRAGLTKVIVFDWDGVHYLYNPDLGTLARPFPRMHLTGAPHLCIKNGSVLEATYFAATYSNLHPGAKTVVVPDPPPGVAFEDGSQLVLYLPSVGRMIWTGEEGISLQNMDSLRRLRERMLAMPVQRGAGANLGSIADHMPGDDADMQIRRLYLALSTAGIPCRLLPGNPETAEFSWRNRTYRYGADQQLKTVRSD